MTAQDILNIVASGEGQKTEFKASFSDAVAIALTAFANAKGGAVYVGIYDDGTISGVVLGKETLQSWLNEIKNKTVPSIVPNVDVVEVQGKTVVVFTVVEYPVKPIAVKGRHYQRRVNANHLLTAVEISNLSLQSRQVSWDSYPYADATFEDLNVDKIGQFIRNVNQSERFVLPDDPRLALDKLGMLVKGVPTNAAMILFSNKNLRYNVHIGRFKTPSLIIDDKMISGNLYDVIAESMRVIIGHLKFSFEISPKGASTKRKEIPEYPLEALRELLMNALVHRDYLSPTDVQIRIYDNSISFFNPSGLYGEITETDLQTDNYRASTRNKQLAEALYLTKDIEKYGSGFIRIRKAIADYPNVCFSYRSADYGFFAELSYEPKDGELNTNVTDRVTNKVTDKVTDKVIDEVTNKVTDNQNIILEEIGKNSRITTQELSDILNISQRKTKENIAKLKAKGLLKRIGTGKNGYWQIVEPNYKETSNGELNTNVTDRVTNKVTDKVTEEVTDKVTDNQNVILEEIGKNSRITTQELSDILNISQRKTKENIAKLKAKGLLKRIGTGKNGYWQIVEPNYKETSNGELNTNVTDRVTNKVTDKVAEEVTDKVTDKVAEEVTDKVTDNQNVILEEIGKNSRITTQELSNILNISQRKTKENIAKLKTKGLLKRIGTGKNGYWQILPNVNKPDTKEDTL